MSRNRHKYPRLHKVEKLPVNTTKKCQATGCTEKAVGCAVIEFTYMRGEDESVNCCRRHGLVVRENVVRFCKQFPPEAWK